MFGCLLSPPSPQQWHSTSKGGPTKRVSTQSRPQCSNLSSSSLGCRATVGTKIIVLSAMRVGSVKTTQHSPSGTCKNKRPHTKSPNCLLLRTSLLPLKLNCRICVVVNGVASKPRHLSIGSCKWLNTNCFAFSNRNALDPSHILSADRASE